MWDLGEWITYTLRHRLFLVESLLTNCDCLIKFDFFNNYLIILCFFFCFTLSSCCCCRLEREHHFVELVRMSWLRATVISFSHGLHLRMLRHSSLLLRLRGDVEPDKKRVSVVSYTMLTSCRSGCRGRITRETIFAQVLFFHHYI